MSESLEYIDAYFNQELDESERKQFELRCSTDEDFAKEVAFYISARQAVKDALVEEKKEQWKTYKVAEQTAPIRKPVLLRRMPYVAAACILFFIAISVFKQTPESIASKYVSEKYTTLSYEMDATRDSMQSAMEEYNKENYAQAATLFDNIRTMDAANADAKKFAGLSYFKIKNYDSALSRFAELSAMTELKANMGDFLQATTLLERNNSGDKEKAKGLLEKVVTEKEDGYQTAEKALQKW